jgi:hypothetical protein
MSKRDSAIAKSSSIAKPSSATSFAFGFGSVLDGFAGFEEMPTSYVLTPLWIDAPITRSDQKTTPITRSDQKTTPTLSKGYKAEGDEPGC